MKYLFPFYNSLFDSRFCDASHRNSTGISERYGACCSQSSGLRRMEDKYELDLELPGFNEKNINMEIQGNLLSIRSVNDANASSEDEEGSLLYRYRLPDTVDFDKISGKIADGLLSITLPLRESEKSRRIALELH